MLYIKAIHIIAVVSWFAGLFYLVRLFIYHVEANEFDDNKKGILQSQYYLMIGRLWKIITVPAMFLTIFSGFWLVSVYDFWTQPFMHIKFAFVFGLVGYHHVCGAMIKHLKNGTKTYSSNMLRIWNEVATLLLVAIVFIIVLKSSLDWIWGFAGFVLFGLILFLAIRIYKKLRNS